VAWGKAQLRNQRPALRPLWMFFASLRRSHLRCSVATPVGAPSRPSGSLKRANIIDMWHNYRCAHIPIMLGKG